MSDGRSDLLLCRLAYPLFHSKQLTLSLLLHLIALVPSPPFLCLMPLEQGLLGQFASKCIAYAQIYVDEQSRLLPPVSSHGCKGQLCDFAFYHLVFQGFENHTLDVSV